MSPTTCYCLDGLLDNLAHWFGILGPYSVYVRVPFGQDGDHAEYVLGAFTLRQALRILASYGYPGSVTKWGRVVALRG